MTRKELQDVQKNYKEMLLKAPDNIMVRYGMIQYLAEEMCYTHHERGQRLWAFFQALKEIEGGSYGAEEKHPQHPVL